MPGEVAPLHRLTAADRGPIVIISAYSWAVVSLVIAIIRFGFARLQRLPFKRDDWTFLAATLFAIASSVAYHVAVNGGLGRHMSVLSPDQIDLYYKMMFTAQYFGIAAMATAKWSFFLLADRVTPQFPTAYYSITSMIAVWAAFSVLAISFQCHLPKAWVYVPNECPTRGNLQYPIILGNILTDTFLAIWFLPTIWRVLMERDKRVTVMSLFGIRIFVAFGAIAQVVFVGINLHKEDQTRASWVPVMITQAVIHLSVVTAAIPRTNHFFTSLTTGVFTMRFTEFELHGSRGDSATPQAREEEPPLKLVPSGIESRIQTSVSTRKKKKGKGISTVDDWRNMLSMGSTRDDGDSQSSLYNQPGSSSGGIAMTQTAETKVEYVRRQPVLVRRT